MYERELSMHPIYLKLGFSSALRRTVRYQRNKALCLCGCAAFWLIVFLIYRGLL